MSIASEITRLQTAKADIKDSIESKGVTVPSSATLDEYSGYIDEIETGGGGGGSSDDDVNFYDYDGTVVESYSADDFANLTAMPANPSHTGLTAQGWNWTLADAKTYVAKYGMLDIGQMYVTDDGKTRIYIHLEEGRKSPMLGVCPKGTVDIDWGDGTAHDTLTGTSCYASVKTVVHEYASGGDYVIKLDVINGKVGFLGDNTWNKNSYLLCHSTTNDDYLNNYYQYAIKKIEIGANAHINSYAFYFCAFLTSITIPEGTTISTSISYYYFGMCMSLKNIIIPPSMRNISSYTFQACHSLEHAILPNTSLAIPSSSFATLSSLKRLTIPETVTSIGTNAFEKTSLKKN